MSCSHYGKTGHVCEDFHRLIDYPDDFEFTKSKSFLTLVKGNAVVVEEESDFVPTEHGESGNTTYSQYLTKEQYSDLL